MVQICQMKVQASGEQTHKPKPDSMDQWEAVLSWLSLAPELVLNGTETETKYILEYNMATSWMMI